MHWSIHTVGPIYDVISNKSNSAISKVGQGRCTDFTIRLFIKRETISCEYLVKKKK